MDFFEIFITWGVVLICLLLRFVYELKWYGMSIASKNLRPNFLVICAILFVIRIILPWAVESNVWVFYILTVVLGGGGAFASGCALARNWRQYWLLFVYMLIFTFGIRFLHFALYQSELLSLKYYVSHGLVIQLSALFGFRLTMAQQMVSKYPFAYERTSLLTWKAKP